MASNINCNTVFESAASNAASTSIPNFVLFGVSIVLIIMSALQAYPTQDFGIDESDETWVNVVCPNDVVQYLSPFHFAIASCPWRPRNTIMRIIVAFVAALTSASVCALLCVPSAKSKLSSLGWLVGWCNWFIFVMMFVMFVLDCDCINTGYVLCNADFKLGDTEFFTIFNVDTQKFEDEKETCLIKPFVYTAMLDLLGSVVAFCAYKMCTYYVKSRAKESAPDMGASFDLPASSAVTKANGEAEHVSQMSISNDITAAGEVGDTGGQQAGFSFSQY